VADANGDNVIGLQDGGQCFTGKDSNYKSQGKKNQYATVTSCAPLGGPWINRVYTKSKWIDQGCWADAPNRTIPFARGANLTLEECQQVADANGDNVIGLQDGGQCFTGKDSNYKSQGKKNQYATVTSCAPLGGPWINHVYTINEKAPSQVKPTPAPSQVKPTPAPSQVKPTPAPSQVKPTSAPSQVKPTSAPNQINDDVMVYRQDFEKARFEMEKHMKSSYNYCCTDYPLCFQWNKCASDPTVEVNNWKDQGCWNDDGSRTIPLMMNETMTLQECRKQADMTDANIFALQNGGQCFIGKDDDYKRLGKSDKCEPTGGPWINHVYAKN
jgi:hypothetical protein